MAAGGRGSEYRVFNSAKCAITKSLWRACIRVRNSLAADGPVLEPNKAQSASKENKPVFVKEHVGLIHNTVEI